MGRLVKNIRKFQFKGMLVILCCFLLMGAILFAERAGIQYQEMARQISYIDKEKTITEKTAMTLQKKTCLVLRDSAQDNSNLAWEQFERILMDMRVGTDVIDIQKQFVPEFTDYETVIVLMSDLGPLKNTVLDLCQWVYDGGNVWFPMTLQKDLYVSMIEQKLGVASSGSTYAVVDSIYFDKDFLIGGGQAYTVTDPYESAWAVQLSEKAKAYAWIGDQKGTPLIWENAYGSGEFVVDNFGFYTKGSRGFYAASYSLLTECGVYPVIDGSVFYLDDFPSPVPGGDGTYVKRDYGTSIADFYTNIWWPDMIDLAARHGVKYTGVIIENYEDKTDGKVKKQADSERFQYFGNMILHQGGELGYHGYNHQPLTLSNVDYGDVLPYNTWISTKAMKDAVSELIRFGKEMFPGTVLSVYVPPSNVLSEEGRKLLGEQFPEIRTIASTYFSGDFAYEQEFEAADDGVIEQPRIISGGIIDDFMQMAALSELNMHFVNNHFMHPDDLLDEDRGAALGWEKLKHRLDEYMTWLNDAAPSLRNLTGSELSGAIQRYGALTIDKEITENQIKLHLGNFYDEAYLMVRINDGKPGEVDGGELTHLTGNLYLLHAQKSDVVIRKEER